MQKSDPPPLNEIDDFIVSYAKLFDFKTFKYDILFEETEVETFFGRKKMENRYYLTRIRRAYLDDTHQLFSYDSLYDSYKFIKPDNQPHSMVSTVYWKKQQDSVNFLTVVKGRMDPADHVSRVVFSSDDLL